MRTVMLDGEVWFVAKDVCDILEIKNPTDAIKSLDEDERSRFYLGRQGEANIINEAGFYALVLRSSKPEAKAFSRWVRHEVLPSIRQTGSYSLKGEQPQFSLRDNVEAAKVILETQSITGNQLTVSSRQGIQTLYWIQYVGDDRPSANRPNTESATYAYANREYFGGMSAKQVNKKLAYAGYQRKVGNGWEATEQGKRYAVMQDTGKWHGGTPVRQLKWDSAILCVFRELIS